MVPELRKRHRLIWQFGSLFLVAGFIGAIWVLPQPPSAGQWPLNGLKPYGRIVAEKTDARHTFRLHINHLRQLQVEIIQHQADAAPLAQVLCNGEFLGVLTHQEQQCFALRDTFSPKASFVLQLRDPINNRTLQKIKLP